MSTPPPGAHVAALAARCFPGYRVIGFGPSSVVMRHTNTRQYPNAILSLTSLELRSLMYAFTRHAERALAFQREGSTQPALDALTALLDEARTEANNGTYE